MLDALLPGIEARLQEQQHHHQRPYPDPHHNNVSSDNGATTAAYRFAARLLPALWRLAAALAADPAPAPAASALARPLAALIGRAEGILLVSCASATPTARVRLLASLARLQHQQQHLREEDGDDEAAAAAAAAAAFMQQLAASNLQGLVGGEGVDTLDGDALAALFGALARTGVEPLRDAAAASALEARARALFPAMPLPTLARFSVGVMRCCAAGRGVYAPSASLVQGVAAALRKRLEGLAAVEGGGEEVPVACWAQVGEVMHALLVLRDGASGLTGGYDTGCCVWFAIPRHNKKRPYRSLTHTPKSHQHHIIPQQARRSSPPPPTSRP